MKKLLIFTLVLLPLLSSAEQKFSPNSSEETSRYRQSPAYSTSMCGTYSDLECRGKYINSLCSLYSNGQTGTCTETGYGDAHGYYVCRCL
jgi:hypothetical protein